MRMGCGMALIGPRVAPLLGWQLRPSIAEDGAAVMVQFVGPNLHAPALVFPNHNPRLLHN